MRRKRIWITLTVAEDELIKRAAEAAGVAPATWVRIVALAAAKKVD